MTHHVTSCGIYSVCVGGGGRVSEEESRDRLVLHVLLPHTVALGCIINPVSCPMCTALFRLNSKSLHYSATLAVMWPLSLTVHGAGRQETSNKQLSIYSHLYSTICFGPDPCYISILVIFYKQNCDESAMRSSYF